MTRSRGGHIALMALLAACETGDGSVPTRVPLGTWGGTDAGLILFADGAHVHVGCTTGEISGPIPVARDGAFTVDGRHNVDAFPVDRGVFHPARYSGRMHGDSRMTVEVWLLDTSQVLGPVELFLGREPLMRTCPICDSHVIGARRKTG